MIFVRWPVRDMTFQSLLFITKRLNAFLRPIYNFDLVPSAAIGNRRNNVLKVR